MNRCEFIGRPVKALELKKTSNGNNILTFTLAVKREYKNPNGEYDSDFIRLKAFKNTANFISTYVKVGDLIYIEATYVSSTYDKDGQKLYSQDLIVTKVKCLSASKSKKEDKKEEVPTTQNEVDLYKQFADETEINENDFPF